MADLRNSCFVELHRDSRRGTAVTSFPALSRIWPMKSKSTDSRFPFFTRLMADPGIFTEIGTK